MLTLLIETSTERGGVFLFKENELLFENYFPPGLHNSASLMPAIQNGLFRTGVSVADLALIGVGVGPGSYTGLRVGAMAAKMLSYACKIPLVSLCTLDCFASSHAENYAVVIDAKIGGVYLKLAHGTPLVCPLNELLLHLNHVNTLVTPNSKMLSVRLQQVGAGHGHLRWEECYPNPHVMLQMTLEAYHRKQYTTDGSAQLLYMRKTQAEIERELAKGKLDCSTQ